MPSAIVTSKADRMRREIYKKFINVNFISFNCSLNDGEIAVVIYKRPISSGIDDTIIYESSY